MVNADIPFGVANPGNVTFIAGSGTDLEFENLTVDELAIFDRDLVKLSRYFSQSRDLQMLFLEDRDVYLWAAAIAKKQLATGFGGNVAGSGQFGMQLIRSKPWLGTASWQQAYSAAGWNNVFGTSSSPIDMSATSTTYLNPQNRVVTVFPKLYNSTLPKVREVWFHIGPTDYPIWPIEFSALGDLYVTGLPATPLIVKNGKFYMRGNILGVGVVDGLAPLGLAFALGEFMTGSGQE
jgi:hypothetical protein